jgi:hypothetical protein
MDYTYHRIALCIPELELEQALTMIYRDLETFAHFNEPKKNIASVSINGVKAHFDLEPSPSAAAAFMAGNSIDVILVKYPESRELFSVTIGDHPLVGVRKWAVRKRNTTVGKPSQVDIDTEAYEQVNGITTQWGRRMSGRGDQHRMWSTYLENIADYWRRTHRATEIDRDFRVPEPAGVSDNPLKSRLPANLQNTRFKDYDVIE